MSEIKPCPFCARSGEPWDWRGDAVRHPVNDIYKGHCVLSGRIFAAQEWNTRPGEEAAAKAATERALKLVQEFATEGGSENYARMTRLADRISRHLKFEAT